VARRPNGRLARTALLSLAALAAGCTGPGRQPAVANAPPAGASAAWSPSLETKRAELERILSASGIAVLRTADNQLQLNVPSDFSFDPGSAAIKPGMRATLDELARDLEAPGLSQLLIRVVGFTDSVGDDAANDALSLARANSVRAYLQDKGVTAGRIHVEGWGERQPAAENDSRYGRALNRRVEITLREPVAK
jgi:outer membrane protein OmpA-like peptidoglycan-associated protein